MIPVEQRHLAVFDERGDCVQHGDCLSACVASILELPLDDVPFFVDSDSWYEDYQRFFRDRGFCIERAWITVDENDPTKLAGSPGDRYWIATVYSPRGKTRCSVCKGEKQTRRQWDGDLERIAILIDREQLGPDDHLWYTHRGGSRKRKHDLTPSDGAMHQWWVAGIEASGLPYRNLHLTRHTFATHWHRRGLSFDDVGFQLRHADPRTTSRVYVHMKSEDVKKRMAACASREEALGVVIAERETVGSPPAAEVVVA